MKTIIKPATALQGDCPNCGCVFSMPFNEVPGFRSCAPAFQACPECEHEVAMKRPNPKTVLERLESNKTDWNTMLDAITDRVADRLKIQKP